MPSILLGSGARVASRAGPRTLRPSMSTKNEFLFDKRILQRNIDKGLVEAKVVDKAMASLPDRTDNVAITSYDDDDVGSDLDASDDEE
jgi:hypothetical protein